MNTKILIFIFNLFFISCSKTYYIPENIKSLMPYKNGDLLIYKSNKNQIDTIFVKTDQFISVNDPLSIFADKEEIFCGYSMDIKNSGYSSNFFKIKSTEKRGVIFSFNFYFKDIAVFYGKNDYTVKELENLKFNNLIINNIEYNDVWILNSNEKMYENRDNYIDKLYWSKTKGLIRFDKRNGEIWELVYK